MQLFLASEAKHPKAIAQLSTIVGGFNGKSIAYIPTAANADGYGSWRQGGSWQLVQTLRANVQLIELESEPLENLRTQLVDKNIIWFAGGMCGYLMYWILRHNLQTYLPDLLNTGTLYVGSSAGSMITAPNLKTTEWYIGETEPGASYLPGLGLVDFDIYPHYQEHQFEEIKKHYRGSRLYLLKDGESIFVDNGQVTVYGESRTLTPAIES